MDDTISRKAAIDAIEKCHKRCCREDATGDEWIHYETTLNEVQCIPPSEPKKMTGHWRHYEGELECSACGARFYDEIMELCGDDVPHFCLDCGADMRGEHDDQR